MAKRFAHNGMYLFGICAPQDVQWQNYGGVLSFIVILR